MARVKRSVASRKKRRKVLDQAKGYVGQSGVSYRKAKEALLHADNYAYRDRKNKKRVFRRLWIIRINAATRMRGMSYSAFVDGLKKAGVELDRKQLSELAIHDPKAFDARVAEEKKANQAAIVADAELGGEKLHATKMYVAKAATKYFPPGSVFADMLDKTGLGSHPEVIRVLSRIGRDMAEDTTARWMWV